MKYPRPITEIHEVEITSRCNLRCVYCTHPKMLHPKVDMSMDTFRRTLEWAQFFDRRGTQKEMSLHGLGESTLNPNFCEMIVLARQALPHVNFLVSTNGVALTKEHVETLRDNGVAIHVSLHRPEKAKLALDLIVRCGYAATTHANFVVNSMNWAGQVSWEVGVGGQAAPKTPCAWLAFGRAVVLSDGAITTCCLDTEKDGIIGHIDQDFNEVVIGTSPYKLCASCHMSVP